MQGSYEDFMQAVWTPSKSGRTAWEGCAWGNTFFTTRRESVPSVNIAILSVSLRAYFKLFREIWDSVLGYTWEQHYIQGQA
jgi:hypothetical protein